MTEMGVRPFQKVLDWRPTMGLPLTTATTPLTFTVSLTPWPRPFVMLSITHEPLGSRVAEFTVAPKVASE